MKLIGRSKYDRDIEFWLPEVGETLSDRHAFVCPNCETERQMTVIKLSKNTSIRRFDAIGRCVKCNTERPLFFDAPEKGEEVGGFCFEKTGNYTTSNSSTGSSFINFNRKMTFKRFIGCCLFCLSGLTIISLMLQSVFNMSNQASIFFGYAISYFIFSALVDTFGKGLLLNILVWIVSAGLIIGMN